MVERCTLLTGIWRERGLLVGRGPAWGAGGFFRWERHGGGSSMSGAARGRLCGSRGCFVG